MLAIQTKFANSGQAVEYPFPGVSAVGNRRSSAQDGLSVPWKGVFNSLTYALESILQA